MAQDRALQAQQETIRIPVFGEDSYDSSTLLGQTYINCYPTITRNAATEEGSVKISKRPGFINTTPDLFATTGAAARTDLAPMANMVMTQLSDVYVCAIGDKTASKIYIIQYRPIANTSVLIGTISSVNILDYIHITEAQINSTGIKAAITVTYTAKDRMSSKCYWAVSDGTKFTAASLTQIVNASFPDQQTPAKVVTGPMQQFNGKFYVMCTDGSVFNSGSTAGTQNDATSWSTLSNILTYQYPDGGIGVYRYKNHLVAYGVDSIEFLNDIGNPPPASSLARTDQAFVKFGALHSMAVVNVNDTLYWVAYGSGDTMGLWKMEGYTPVKLSTTKQDNAIKEQLSNTKGNELTRFSVFPILLNNKIHIGINSLFTRTQLNTTNTVTWGNQLSDTYRVQQTRDMLRCSALMYSIDDKVWWGMDFFGQFCSFFPANAYIGPQTTATNAYAQYILISQETTVAYTISPARVYGLTPITSGSFIDYSPDTSLSSLPVVVAVQFNTLEFDNLNYKTIPKATLTFEQTPYKSHSDFNTYSISLFYNKSNEDPNYATLVERYQTYPSSQNRYYWNNLGMGRRWNFTIVSLNADPFPLKNLELSVAQGVH